MRPGQLGWERQEQRSLWEGSWGGGKKPNGLQWFIPLFSFALVGVNGSCQACTSADLLCLCLGNGASPRGPEFCISIRHPNGPPFAACHHKIGGTRAVRVSPAERTSAVLLCSMTPLSSTVDFASPPLPVPWAYPFYSILSRSFNFNSCQCLKTWNWIFTIRSCCSNLLRSPDFCLPSH